MISLTVLLLLCSLAWTEGTKLHANKRSNPLKQEKRSSGDCLPQPTPSQVSPFYVDICFDYSEHVNCVVRRRTGYASVIKYFQDMTSEMNRILKSCLGDMYPRLRFGRAEMIKNLDMDRAQRAGKKLGKSGRNEQIVVGYCNNPDDAPTRYSKLRSYGCDVTLVITADPNLCCGKTRGSMMMGSACSSSSCGFACLDATISSKSPFGATTFYAVHELLHSLGLSHDNYGGSQCNAKYEQLIGWKFWCTKPEQCDACTNSVRQACLRGSCPACSCGGDFLMRDLVRTWALPSKLSSGKSLCTDCTRAKFILLHQYHMRNLNRFQCLQQSQKMKESTPPKEKKFHYQYYYRKLTCAEKSFIQAKWKKGMTCHTQQINYARLTSSWPQFMCGRPPKEDTLQYYQSVDRTASGCMGSDTGSGAEIEVEQIFDEANAVKQNRDDRQSEEDGFLQFAGSPDVKVDHETLKRESREALKEMEKLQPKDDF